MAGFSLLPQQRHVTFDLFADLKPAGDVSEATSASSPAGAGEEAPGADGEPTIAAGSRQSFVLLGLGFIAGSAAVWAIGTGQQAPSVTVAVPRAEAPIPASPLPRLPHNAAKGLPAKDLGDTVGRAEQLSKPLPAPVASDPPHPARLLYGIVATTARVGHPKQARSEPAPSMSAPVVPPPDIAGSTSSRYTSLEPAACTFLEKADVPLRRCEGVAGYEIEAVDAKPDGYLAIVGPGGTRSELGFSSVAPGGSLGKLAEWRTQGGREPRALIVRVNAPGKVPVSSLIVAKLDAKPCIVAVIPRGPRQNEKARSVADREQLECPTG